MDVQMPEMDGFDAAKAIRKRWPNGSPHISAVTAHALEGDRKRCIEAGMDDYISKPVRQEELASALGRVFPAAGRYEERLAEVRYWKKVVLQAFSFGRAKASTRPVITSSTR
jgi:DNA-binding response OmpR family regulator